MQKVFDLTNKYIILATPLILYSLISSIYLSTTIGNGKIINLIIAFLLFMMMAGAFIAGWFNMIKIAVTFPNNDEPNSLIKQFPAGVGEYFLPAMGSISIMLIISIFMLIISYYIGLHFIGDTGIASDSLSKALQNSNELKAFVNALTPEQLNKLNSWNMLILGTVTFSYFIFFLYLPTLFFKKSNPFLAFFTSLKDLFSRKIFKTAGIFLLIFIINFIISIFSTIFANNLILHFIITLLSFYFITIASVGVFHYYYQNFIRPMLGQNVDVQV